MLVQDEESSFPLTHYALEHLSFPATRSAFESLSLPMTHSALELVVSDGPDTLLRTREHMPPRNQTGRNLALRR
jgi:hypothetical protein